MSIPKQTFYRKEAIMDEEEHFDSLLDYDSDSYLSDIDPNKIIEEAGVSANEIELIVKMIN